MVSTLSSAFTDNFLGGSPLWYKRTILAFLLINPLLLWLTDPFTVGWLLIIEFIFTLAMALKCYPLQPGGLLAIEAVAIGLTTAHGVYHEIAGALEVILLLIFMVAGIFYMKSLLLLSFTKILINIRSKTLISLLFLFVSAFLSAFLDALTVTAVIIAVATGFYSIYHKVASGKQFHHEHDHSKDGELQEKHEPNLQAFRRFLRNLLMHGAIGTALGGVCTLVGEPQNLLIAERAGWQFFEFFLRMVPITMPVFLMGIITCIVLEKTRRFDYGGQLPNEVRDILEQYDQNQDQNRSTKEKARLVIQALVGLWLIVALSLHLAAVGVIGLSVIVLLTAFNGIIEEHRLGKSFAEGLPFTALLVVFFAIIAVIQDQGLFNPIINWVLTLEGKMQVLMFFSANGILSMISDNFFVATIYINQIKEALEAGQISREQFDLLAVAINAGTNIPSVATPNGQAAFLFLLTSAVAPLVRLSYGRMVWMALPYTLTLTTVGLLATFYLLAPMTDTFTQLGWLVQSSGGH